MVNSAYDNTLQLMAILTIVNPSSHSSLSADTLVFLISPLYFTPFCNLDTENQSS